MYIEKIQSPADLKQMDLETLQFVVEETRQAVLNRVSKHGGHVGPNLGFVEATVALHYVFNAPYDKFVFDVSHQCYPHKVLTGRASGFWAIWMRWMKYLVILLLSKAPYMIISKWVIPLLP